MKTAEEILDVPQDIILAIEKKFNFKIQEAESYEGKITIRTNYPIGTPRMKLVQEYFETLDKPQTN